MKSNNWLEHTLDQVEKILNKQISVNMSLEDVPLVRIEEAFNYIEHSRNEFRGYKSSSKNQAAYLEMFNTRDMGAWLSLQYAEGKPNLYKPLPLIAEEVKKYLLYYNKLVLVEPICSATYDAPSWASSLKLNRIDAIRRYGNTILNEGLRFWASLRPLVKEGLIIGIPSSHLFATITNADVKMLDEEDNSQLDKLEAAQEKILSIYGNHENLQDVIAIARGENNLNRSFFNVKLIYCRDNNYELVPQSLFGTILLYTKALMLSHLIPNGKERFNTEMSLAVCKLPKLVGIENKELLQLHNDEDSFKVWRNKYNKIASSNTWVTSDSFNLEFRNEIFELGHELERSLEQYKLGKKVKKAGLDFTAGAIGTFSIAPDPVSAIIGGGMTTVSSLIMSLLFDKPRKTDLAMKKVFRCISESSTGEIPIL